jgi:hypothetical protein
MLILLTESFVDSSQWRYADLCAFLRICPGRYLAVRNAQLFAAAVLSHYYIQQSVGRIPPNIIKFTGTEIR